jgi:hypothetical protein
MEDKMGRFDFLVVNVIPDKNYQYDIQGNIQFVIDGDPQNIEGIIQNIKVGVITRKPKVKAIGPNILRQFVHILQQVAQPPNELFVYTKKGLKNVHDVPVDISRILLSVTFDAETLHGQQLYGDYINLPDQLEVDALIALLTRLAEAVEHSDRS